MGELVHRSIVHTVPEQPTVKMGAKTYGFQVAWVNRTRAQANAMGIAPNVVLARLDELPRVFPAE